MKLKFTPFLLLLAFSCQNENKESGSTETEQEIPYKTGAVYTMRSGNVSVEIDSAAGARVSSLKIDGKEILYLDRDSNNNNWGSTFWPSPQALWGWPPPAILDNSPYKTKIDKNSILFSSNIAEVPPVSFDKEFSFDVKDTSLKITYTIHNHGDSVIKISAWEITRVPAGGLILFPRGNDTARGELSLLIQDSLNVTWLDYDSARIPQGVPKLFADAAEGWLAFVNNKRQVLIKKFEDSKISEKAPDPENEIELYTNPNRAYTEIEEQGPYTSVNSNKSTSWTVKWYVRDVPAGIDIRVGSIPLIEYIRKTVK